LTSANFVHRKSYILLQNSSN